MPTFDCKSRRGTKISVIALGSALCFVMMAYFVFGDNNDEQGLRNLRMISIVRDWSTSIKVQHGSNVCIQPINSCSDTGPRIPAALIHSIRTAPTIGKVGWEL